MKHEQFNIKEKWADATKNARGLADIYDLPGKDAAELEALLASDIIATSFFLPREILDLPGLRISQLSVLGSSDFITLAEILQFGCNSCYKHADVNFKLIFAAKNIGVSLRYYKHSLYIVCKVWYGSPPEHSSTSRLKHLIDFINATKEKE